MEGTDIGFITFWAAPPGELQEECFAADFKALREAYAVVAGGTSLTYATEGSNNMLGTAEEVVERMKSCAI